MTTGRPTAADRPTATGRRARRRRRPRADRGAVTLEAAILAPVLLAMISVAVFAMRVEVANEAVAFAAHDAARIASLARTEGEAVRRGSDTARATLQREGLSCLGTPDVRVNASQFKYPVGETAVVSATVTCTLRLSDLGLPGLPGTKVVTATFTSYLDQFRSRS